MIPHLPSCRQSLFDHFVTPLKNSLSFYVGGGVCGGNQLYNVALIELPGCHFEGRETFLGSVPLPVAVAKLFEIQSVLGSQITIPTPLPFTVLNSADSGSVQACKCGSQRPIVHHSRRPAGMVSITHAAHPLPHSTC